MNRTVTPSVKPLWIIAKEELGDVWSRGWGWWVMVAVGVALSGTALGLAYTTQINLLDAREGLAILVRISLGVGVLLTAFTAADSISGERDRATLESLLLTPTLHRHLVWAKLLMAGAWWVAAFVVSAPYLLAMGLGLGGADALIAGGAVGIAFAVMFSATAGTISVWARTNLESFGLVLLGAGVLAIPGFLPGAMTRDGIGAAVIRIDPITAGQQFINRVVIDQQPISAEWVWLISPIVGAIVAVAVASRYARRIALEPRS